MMLAVRIAGCGDEYDCVAKKITGKGKKSDGRSPCRCFACKSTVW